MFISQLNRLLLSTIIAVPGIMTFVQNPANAKLNQQQNQKIFRPELIKTISIQIDKNTIQNESLVQSIQNRAVTKRFNTAIVRPEQIVEGALSGAIERYVERQLGSEQFPHSNNWGNKIRIKSGVKVVKVRKCRRVLGQKICHYEPQTRAVYKKVNHGLWSKGWVRLEDDLNIKLGNFSFRGNKLRFRAVVSGLLRNNTDFKAYNHGVFLGSTRVKGRARVKTTVNMEISFSQHGRSLKWRVRSTGATIKLEDVYVDRISRISGYSAKVIGDTVHGAFRYWFTNKYNQVRRNTVNSIVQAAAHDREIKLAYPRLINSRK
ncbi:hypothetical protein Riv7116_1686 [Rivularia sp. PCC 7116]|uniref:hypothetical protein n=1 Tax=Rivularia sp. PCC 7116 TaxID=373994 RepID=UPI00029ECBA1|nr:hypothetical protein [Rivularia sp. PCC 7116]AFY54235.1 hypothetical protein Riv7116_1686 [Rivularia sp. PCC 7116]